MYRGHSTLTCILLLRFDFLFGVGSPLHGNSTNCSAEWIFPAYNNCGEVNFDNFEISILREWTCHTPVVQIFNPPPISSTALTKECVVLSGQGRTSPKTNRTYQLVSEIVSSRSSKRIMSTVSPARYRSTVSTVSIIDVNF